MTGFLSETFEDSTSGKPGTRRDLIRAQGVRAVCPHPYPSRVGRADESGSGKASTRGESAQIPGANAVRRIATEPKVATIIIFAMSKIEQTIAKGWITLAASYERSHPIYPARIILEVSGWSRTNPAKRFKPRPSVTTTKWALRLLIGVPPLLIARRSAAWFSGTIPESVCATYRDSALS